MPLLLALLSCTQAEDPVLVPGSPSVVGSGNVQLCSSPLCSTTGAELLPTSDGNAMLCAEEDQQFKCQRVDASGSEVLRESTPVEIDGDTDERSCGSLTPSRLFCCQRPQGGESRTCSIVDLTSGEVKASVDLALPPDDSIQISVPMTAVSATQGIVCYKPGELICTLLTYDPTADTLTASQYPSSARDAFGRQIVMLSASPSGGRALLCWQEDESSGDVDVGCALYLVNDNGMEELDSRILAQPDVPGEKVAQRGFRLESLGDSAIACWGYAFNQGIGCISIRPDANEKLMFSDLSGPPPDNSMGRSVTRLSDSTAILCSESDGEFTLSLRCQVMTVSNDGLYEWLSFGPAWEEEDINARHTVQAMGERDAVVCFQKRTLQQVVCKRLVTMPDLLGERPLLVSYGPGTTISEEASHARLLVKVSNSRALGCWVNSSGKAECRVLDMVGGETDLPTSAPVGLLPTASPTMPLETCGADVNSASKLICESFRSSGLCDPSHESSAQTFEWCPVTCGRCSTATDSPTAEPTDPPTDEADDSFAGPASFDQTKWGPISDYVVTIADAGKDSTPHHYVYSNLGESCHHACMRKSPPGDTWYCDDQSLFFVDINADGVTEMNKRSDQIMNDDCLPANSVGVAAGPQDCQGRCTNPTDATVRTISRNKSAWAPFIRADGKCFYAHFKGKHKCYIPRSNNYRLCGCQSYSDAVGEDFAPNMNVVEGDGSTGWHVVTDKNCNNHCESLGLTCNASVLNGFKGAYDMRALENLLTDGALDMCDMWDDRLVKKKNPAYRDVDKRCYVNPVDANGDAACNLMSRSPDTRFCYCGDAMA